MSAAPLRSTARKRGREENAGDGRRSGLVKVVVFDETAAGFGPGTGSMRDSPPEQSRRDRERQRRDQDPRSRPTTPGRPGGVARRDQGHGLIRVERCWASRGGTREPSGIPAKAGGSPSSEAPLDHAPSRFRPDARRGSPLHLRKPGGEGDSRIERSMECSYRKSVADVGRAHLPQRGGAGRKA
jgi:hypothetical protein